MGRWGTRWADVTAKPSKYRNQPVTDPETGKRVDSKREMNRLTELRRLHRSGEFDVLATQVRFRLEGAMFVLDYAYGPMVLIDGVPYLRLTVEDAKGVRTPVYRQKKRQLQERYGLEVVES